jgi:Flp pilus assembly protein TadB
MGTMTVLRLLLGLASFGAVYFLGVWFRERRRLKSLSYIELRNLQISEETARERRGSAKARLKERLQRAGYQGDLAPFFVGIAFLYMTLSAVCLLVGFPPALSLLIAVPGSVGTTVSLVGIMERRRQAAATAQMLQVLRNVITYLEAGNTPQQAFNKAAMLVGNPLRSDILNAIGSQVGAVGMGTVMAPLRDKYNSPATRLLVGALEVNDLVGARLVPTLRQAEDIVQRQTELAAEANAEISQARAEFIGISAVIGLIATSLLFGAGDEARDAYLSPTGLTVIFIAGANYALGIWRTLRVFRKAKRGMT